MTPPAGTRAALEEAIAQALARLLVRDVQRDDQSDACGSLKLLPGAHQPPAAARGAA